jgi:uncharacterized protein YifN (PemK superfamily)
MRGAIVLPLPPGVFPRQGDVWMCDFVGNVVPEIVKRRRVIIISPRNRGAGICLVVPVSTRMPTPSTGVHVRIPANSYTCFGNVDVWVKADLISHVRFARLDRVRVGSRYIHTVSLTAEHLVEVQKGVVHALGLGRLTDNI